MTDWLNNPTGSIGPAFNPEPVVAKPVPKQAPAVARTTPKPSDGKTLSLDDMFKLERTAGSPGVDALASFRNQGSDGKIAIKAPTHVVEWVRKHCEGNLNTAVIGLVMWAIADLERRGERLVVRANSQAGS